MAINTAAKRRSAGGTGCIPLTPGVTPNAAKPVEWRQQSAWGYSGVAPPAIIGGTFYADAVGWWSAGAGETQPWLAGADPAAPRLAGAYLAAPWLAGAEPAAGRSAGGAAAQSSPGV